MAETSTGSIGRKGGAWWAVLLGASLLGLGSTAFAQAADKQQRAGELFAEGVKHFEAERFEQALADFEQAYRLAPHHAVRVNMAACFAELDRPVEAVFNYQRFLSEGEGSIPPAQAREVRAAIAKLEKELGELELQVSPKAATVHVDGRRPRELPDGRVVLAVGAHEVEAFALGYESYEGRLQVKGGEKSTVTISLEKVPEVAAVPPTAGAAGGAGALDGSALEQPAETSRRPWWMQRATHWTFGGVALAAGMSAAITGGLHIAARNDFDDAVRRSNDPNLSAIQRAQARADGLQYADRADALARASNGLFGAAGALGVGALVMWIVTHKRDKAAEAPQVSLQLGPDRTGLTLAGTF